MTKSIYMGEEGGVGVGGVVGVVGIVGVLSWGSSRGRKMNTPP